MLNSFDLNSVCCENMHDYLVVLKCCITNVFAVFLCARASTAIARISYSNSVRLSVRHNPVPFHDQLR